MPKPTRTDLDRVRRAIAALPEPTRTVYRLHVFEDLDYRAIAERLGFSVAQIEQHVAEAIVLTGRALPKMRHRY